MVEVSPDSLLSGTLPRYGASAVSRVSDRGCVAALWQRYNKYTETFRGSQSGFPLLTPTMQAGQDSDGRVGGSEGMCTLQAVTVWWFWH